MTTLDTLARNSAAAIHHSVAFVPVPAGGITRTSRRFVFRRSLGYAMAGAAAAVIAVFAMLSVATPVDEVTDSTVLTSTTVAEPDIQTTVPTEVPVENPDGVVPVVPPEGSRQVAPGDTTPPHIVILSPENGASTTRSAVVVTGIAEAGTRITGQTDGPVDVDDEGVWSAEVRLDLGKNRIVFTAIDEAGNFATASVSVTRTAPPTTTTTKPADTTTTTTEAPGWEFSAHQTYGSCSDSPPYDIYYGTGKPGTEISVTSEYGNGSTTVAENGEWSVKVFFPSAPAHTGFIVKVYHFDGSKKTFEFTYTPV